MDTVLHDFIWELKTEYERESEKNEIAFRLKIDRKLPSSEKVQFPFDFKLRTPAFEDWRNRLIDHLEKNYDPKRVESLLLLLKNTTEVSLNQAEELVDMLTKLSGASIDPSPVRSDILVFRHPNDTELAMAVVEFLEGVGIKREAVRDSAALPSSANVDRRSAPNDLVCDKNSIAAALDLFDIDIDGIPDLYAEAPDTDDGSVNGMLINASSILFVITENFMSDCACIQALGAARILSDPRVADKSLYIIKQPSVKCPDIDDLNPAVFENTSLLLLIDKLSDDFGVPYKKAANNLSICDRLVKTADAAFCKPSVRSK